MVHEGLQRHIVGEDGLRRTRGTAVRARGMCRRRVEFGKQEPRLGPVRVADDETWQGESILNQILQYVSKLQQWSLCTTAGTLASSLGCSKIALKFS